MIRALLTFAVILVLALGAVWVADRPGTVAIDWLGVRIEATIALTLTALLVLALLLYATVRLIAWLVGRVSSVGQFMSVQGERRARQAVATGLVALAAGDAETARKVARDAVKRLPDQPLTLLLRAQTAERLGQADDVERAYEAMLTNDKTELLGLIGLMRILNARGETLRARDFAERAFALRPSSSVAFDFLFALHAREADWPAAQKVLDGAIKARAIGKTAGDRYAAVLSLAEAAGEREAERSQQALTLALRALDLAPDFAPAAVMSADILKNFGKKHRAGTIIEAIWPTAPHPDLGRIYAQIGGRESAETRWRRIVGLITLNRDHRESRILFARYALAADMLPAARDALRPLLEPAPTVRVAELMAKIEERDGADPASVEHWYQLAHHVARDAVWLCRSCGRQSTTWSAVCPHCHSFDSQYWKAFGDRAVLDDEGEILEDPDLFDLEDETGAPPAGLWSRLFGGGASGAELPPETPLITHQPEAPMPPAKPAADQDKPAPAPQPVTAEQRPKSDPPEAPKQAPKPAEKPAEKPASQPADRSDNGPKDQPSKTREPERQAPKDHGPARGRDPRPEPIMYTPPRPPDDPGPAKPDQDKRDDGWA